MEVAPGRGDVQGLLSLRVAGEGPAAAQALVRVMQLALKGALPAGRGPGPLHLVGMDGPPALLLSLARAMLLPRAALQIAQLRQVSLPCFSYVLGTIEN